MELNSNTKVTRRPFEKKEKTVPFTKAPVLKRVFLKDIFNDVKKQSIRPDVNSIEENDYVNKKYKLYKNPYLHNILTRYRQMHRIYKINEMNPDSYTSLCSNDIVYETDVIMLHKPTICDTATMLSATILNDYKSFKFNSGNTHFSKAEKSYWFGIHVLPRIMQQLGSYSGNQINSYNLAATAMEVYYRILQMMHMSLPHMHLLNIMYPEDVTQLDQYLRGQTAWKFEFNKKRYYFNLNARSFINFFLSSNGTDYLFSLPIQDMEKVVAPTLV